MAMAMAMAWLGAYCWCTSIDDSVCIKTVLKNIIILYNGGGGKPNQLADQAFLSISHI
jgi:hypothetical protein